MPRDMASDMAKGRNSQHQPRQFQGAPAMTQPTAEQIARARRIVKETLNPERHKRCRCRDEIDAGEWDNGHKVRIALAAIMETQEACAKVADKHRMERYAARDNANQRKETREARDHESMAIEAGHVAAAIRAGVGDEA